MGKNTYCVKWRTSWHSSSSGYGILRYAARDSEHVLSLSREGPESEVCERDCMIFVVIIVMQTQLLCISDMLLCQLCVFLSVIHRVYYQSCDKRLKKTVCLVWGPGAHAVNVGYAQVHNRDWMLQSCASKFHGIGSDFKLESECFCDMSLIKWF